MYLPTMGVEVHPYTVRSGVICKIWDCAGQQALGGLREGYYLEAKVAMIFTGGDECNPAEYGNRSVEWYINELKNTAPDATIFVVHNPNVERVKATLDAYTQKAGL